MRQTIASLLKSHGIALTGGVATGKSTVAAMIAAAGIPVIDADQLAREVVAPNTAGLRAIAAEFGCEILASDGSLDRKAMAALVFADPEKRRRLEAITHPLIQEALAARLFGLGLVDHPAPFVYEAALIVELGRDREFAEMWVTWCPRPLQLSRLQARSGLTAEAANQLIASQMAATAKAARATKVIDTSGDLSAVRTQVDGLLSGLTRRAT